MAVASNCIPGPNLAEDQTCTYIPYPINTTSDAALVFINENNLGAEITCTLYAGASQYTGYPDKMVCADVGYPDDPPVPTIAEITAELLGRFPTILDGEGYTARYGNEAPYTYIAYTITNKRITLEAMDVCSGSTVYDASYFLRSYIQDGKQCKYWDVSYVLVAEYTPYSGDDNNPPVCVPNTTLIDGFCTPDDGWEWCEDCQEFVEIYYPPEIITPIPQQDTLCDKYQKFTITRTENTTNKEIIIYLSYIGSTVETINPPQFIIIGAEQNEVELIVEIVPTEDGVLKIALETFYT